jgi:hypothetical protein
MIGAVQVPMLLPLLYAHLQQLLAARQARQGSYNQPFLCYLRYLTQKGKSDGEE